MPRRPVGAPAASGKSLRKFVHLGSANVHAFLRAPHRVGVCIVILLSLPQTWAQVRTVESYPQMASIDLDRSAFGAE